MAKVTKTDTIASLVEKLSGMPLKRNLVSVLPGTATEQDAIDMYIHDDRWCELVDSALGSNAKRFVAWNEDELHDGDDVRPSSSHKLHNMFAELDRQA